jgi:hypothetical protein
MSPRLRRLHGRLARAIGAEAMDRLVDPILTDIRMERRLAIRQLRPWKSRWVVAAGTVSLAAALVSYGWVNFWSFQRWPAEDRLACARTLKCFAAVTPVAMALLILQVWPQGWHPTAPVMFITRLTLQTVPIAILFGLLLSVLYGLHGTIVALRSSAAVLILSSVCSLASFAMLAWIVPETEWRFRVAVTGDSNISRRVNELTLGELRDHIAAERRLGEEPTGTALSYHARWALAAAPAVMATWALLVVACGDGRRWVTALAAVATWAGYVAFIGLGRAATFYGVVPPSFGAWSPNLALGIAALLLAGRITFPRQRTANIEP